MDNIELLRFFSKQPQRAKPIYYILVGKKTASNLLAACEGHYLAYYHSAPSLKWADTAAILQDLVRQKQLQAADERAYVLTTSGQASLSAHPTAVFQLKHYEGLAMPHAWIALQTLYLAIQVLSEYRHGRVHYIPVTDDLKAQWQVRRWFQMIKAQASNGQAFVKELTAWLTQLPTAQADFLAANFSGHHYGYSQASLKAMFGYPAYTQQLIQLDGIGLLLKNCQNNPDQWPMSHFLLRSYLPRPLLSDSAQQTYGMMQRGISFSQLVKGRGLKESTIREHLLEAALFVPDFAFAAISANPDLMHNEYFMQRLTTIKEMRGDG